MNEDYQGKTREQLKEVLQQLESERGAILHSAESLRCRLEEERKKLKEQLQPEFQKVDRFSQEIKTLENMFKSNTFCDYCGKSFFEPYTPYIWAGKYCSQQCFDTYFAEGNKKEVLGAIGKLPVLIEYAGRRETKISADCYFYPREFEPIASKYEETTADAVFSYEQMETIYNCLSGKEAPTIVHIQRFMETFYWEDEWTDACEVTILLELTSGKKIQLFKGDEPHNSKSNNYYGYSLEEIVEEENRK